jgi:hypothetical protein
MLDEIVNLSFDLDYTILQSVQLGKVGKYSRELENATIRSDNIFLEYEGFIAKSRVAFTELMGILTQCDEQRKVSL